MQFILGVIVGIVISAVGLTTIAGYVDRGVHSLQDTVKEVAK